MVKIISLIYFCYEVINGLHKAVAIMFHKVGPQSSSKAKFHKGSPKVSPENTGHWWSHRIQGFILEHCLLSRKKNSPQIAIYACV